MSVCGRARAAVLQKGWRKAGGLDDDRSRQCHQPNFLSLCVCLCVCVTPPTRSPAFLCLPLSPSCYFGWSSTLCARVRLFFFFLTLCRHHDCRLHLCRLRLSALPQTKQTERETCSCSSSSSSNGTSPQTTHSKGGKCKVLIDTLSFLLCVFDLCVVSVCVCRGYLRQISNQGCGWIVLLLFLLLLALLYAASYAATAMPPCDHRGERQAARHATTLHCT
jgi:hypothetical protein